MHTVPTPRHPAEVRATVLARLDAAGADVFRFADVDVADDVVRLQYEIDGLGSFTEQVGFDGVDVESAVARPEVAAAVHLLHVAAGVSYLKTVVPPVLDLGSVPVTGRLRTLLREVVTEGLGEFAHVNGLDLRSWFRVIGGTDRTRTGARATADAGPLVPVGGGKDSIVTLDALRGLGPTLFAVNPRGPITRTITAAGMPAITATRTLDPTLFDLNDRGALNGHVPVTAIVSAIAVLAATLHGHGAVVMSNEASADQPTLTLPGGATVNHQWSKSSAFEHAFADVVRDTVRPDLEYVSFLRPASELAIARRFASLEGWDTVFNSCNRAFHLRREATEWCGDCPKCRFVFLALAPFTAPGRLEAIFGGNLLDDPDQVDGVAALAELGTHRPFECVGDAHESRAALACLASRPAWADTVVVRALAPRVPAGCDALERRLHPEPTGLPAWLHEAFRDAF